MPDWLSQNLFSNIAWAVLVFGGGILFAFLKKYREQWAPAALYGIGGAASIAILIFAFTGHGLFVKPLEPTSSKNVEEHVKTWSSTFGLAIQPITFPDTTFAYRVTLSNGDSVGILRGEKSSPGYVQFYSQIALAPEHQIALAKLTDEQAIVVWQQVSLDLARLNLNFQLNGQDVKHMRYIALAKGVAIPNLTESSYAANLDQMDNGMLVAKSSLMLALHQFQQPSVAVPADQK